MVTFFRQQKKSSVSSVNACYVISSSCVKKGVFNDGDGYKNFAKQEKPIDV
jgi:hypothetical protein